MYDEDVLMSDCDVRRSERSGEEYGWWFPLYFSAGRHTQVCLRSGAGSLHLLPTRVT